MTWKPLSASGANVATPATVGWMIGYENRLLQNREQWEALDDIAERIRSLGALAPQGYSTFSNLTAIKDGHASLDSDAMVAELMHDNETVLATVRHAVKAMCGLKFAYDGGSTPGRIREVAPYGLMFGRTNYLVAAELGSDEPKSWRLDRIRDLTLMDCPAPAPEDFSLSAFAGRSFGVFHGDAEELVLRIKPHGAADALGWRFHSNQQVAEVVRNRDFHPL